MSNSERDWFKTYTGEKAEDAFRVPSAESSVDQYADRASSRYPLVKLGWGDDGETYISQEDRANHMHILGATQEGKSKFIELLMRDDIRNGYGACLIDPSRGGANAYKVLKHCAATGFDKVVLIDPADILSTGRVPAIQPLREGIPEAVINGNIMDTTRVLWSADDFSKNPRIQKYLPAVIQALVVNKLTLADLRVFLSNTDYFEQRERLLAHPDLDDLNRNHIKGAFRNAMTFEHFQSTVNRLNPFNDPVLRLLFGSRRTWSSGDGEGQAHWGVPWSKLITEGWVILVNADPTEVWGHDNPVPQRLMSTVIIGELIHAISRLVNRGWTGAYYLYIDEVGYYATRKLANLLDYHAKTGLRLVVAHQRFEQVEDDSVLSAIRTNAKNKVLFNTPNVVDRDAMLRDMGYGGDLPDRQVSYILGQLHKGQAALRVGRRNPKIFRVKRIPDAQVGSTELSAFKAKLYSREWYYAKDAIEDELNARHRDNQAPGPAGPKWGANRDKKGARRPRAGDGKVHDGEAPGPDDAGGRGGAPRKSYFRKKVRPD